MTVFLILLGIIVTGLLYMHWTQNRGSGYDYKKMTPKQRNAADDLETYKRHNVEEYQVISVLDNRTCEVCGKKDLRVFKVKNAKIGKNFPPFHEGCRCTTVEAQSKVLLNERTARDPQTNKIIYVPASMSYSEYKKRYLQ